MATVAEWYRYRARACLVTSSSPVPLKTRRVGQRCTLNLSSAETSSHWCGVVVRRGGCQLRCRPRHLTLLEEKRREDMLESVIIMNIRRQTVGLGRGVYLIFRPTCPHLCRACLRRQRRKRIPVRASRKGLLFLSFVVLTCRRSCQVIYSQFGLAIHQNDHQARRRFVEWAQNEIAVVPDFHKRILFSDEAHFWLNGYVNKQNCRIWSEANPQVYVETPLHPEKLTVWCALWAGGILLQKR
ncbi:uncharacterized protein TNCV_448731 [Trichonephila clavipes]|nr:uncharacterized protein TNCV_448731 [Trichonephila clavipes]